MSAVSRYRSRFTRPVFLWALTALVIEVVVQRLGRYGWPSTETRWLTLLPLVPMLFFNVALVRTVLKMDELQKRICQESAFIAFVLTLFLTLVFFAVERAHLGRPHWDDIGAAMLILWACAYVFCSRRYQ